MKNSNVIAQAPGRINIIGEHIDYNDGLVLPASIDKYTTVWLKRNDTQGTCRVLAKNLDQSFEFDLKSFEPIKSGWQNYVMGVVYELQQLGMPMAGFDCEFEGNVPIGSGMSSSAALECSFAVGLNTLFGLGIDKNELIKATQRAEHRFVGTQCGIMDQFASVMGKEGFAIQLDCRNLTHKYVPFNLSNYRFLLLNTNVSHNLASSEYNQRREECEKAISILQQRDPSIQSLRDISVAQLQQYQNDLPESLFKRAHHVVTEIQRTKDATRALENQDLRTLGELMYQSHRSLQKDYQVSCPELDFLVEQTLDKPYILGSRMMGGGFGGCTLNLIEQDQMEAFTALVGANYKNQFGVELTPYKVSIGNGAHLVN